MIKIIGAGIAGLLAANMLRRHDPVVYEAAPSLPNNHSAVLRFRSSVVGDVLGIPFKKVSVIKSQLPWKNPVADALAYSRKNGGQYRSDRSISSPLLSSERYIAPPDLIERMAEGVDVVYGERYSFRGGDKVISTIPMNDLMRALEYPEKLPSEFRWKDGVNLLARVKSCDAYVSLYVPDPDLPFSRISLTGDELIAELPGNKIAHFDDMDPIEIAQLAAKLVGIDPSDLHSINLKEQSYSKILPIDEGERRKFIYWASTETGRAFSLGRFATWRPGLLADDLVQDVRIIEKMMTSKSQKFDAQLMERRKTTCASL